MSGNTNPKGNNNQAAWEAFETPSKPIVVKESITEDDEDVQEVIGFDLYQDNGKEDFSDVLQLTQYEGGGLMTERNTDYVIAEYEDIKPFELEKKHQLEAKKFVSRITKFVLDFNDLVLTEEHKAYVKQVGQLQLQHLSDLLYLTDVNKKMLNNIISRVNATQAEDYAIINSYNNLANQHLKLIKELQNTYKAIPSVMKKMRADVICNQELVELQANEDELVTENFGETQFNNSKQMLRTILENKKKAEENK